MSNAISLSSELNPSPGIGLLRAVAGEALRIRGKKFKQKICLKIVQNALKWSLQYANFQKFSGRACSQTCFLSVNLLQINSAGKDTLEKMSKFNALAPENISGYAPDMKHFYRAYVGPFLSLNI